LNCTGCIAPTQTGRIIIIDYKVVIWMEIKVWCMKVQCWHSLRKIISLRVTESRKDVMDGLMHFWFLPYASLFH